MPRSLNIGKRVGGFIIVPIPKQSVIFGGSRGTPCDHVIIEKNLVWEVLKFVAAVFG